jgi:hypothetical protein
MYRPAAVARNLHGKEGVDGSSPSEGSAKAPHVGAFSFRATRSSSNVRWVWSRLWSFQVQNAPCAPQPRPIAGGGAIVVHVLNRRASGADAQSMSAIPRRLRRFGSHEPHSACRACSFFASNSLIPAVSGGRSRANRPPGPSDSGRTNARSSKPSSSASTDPPSLGRERRAVCSRLPRRPASTRTNRFRPESKSPEPEGEPSYEGSRCSLDSRRGVPGLVDSNFTSSAVSSASAAESWID